MFEHIKKGVTGPFKDGSYDSNDMKACALIYGGLGLVGGGMLARRRATAGKPPIAGFLL